MATDTVQHLGCELGHRFFVKTLENSREAQALHDQMVKEGLEAQPERSHLFNVFSPDSLRSVAVSITPFSSKDLYREGGLSVSEGGHAQGVIVEVADRVTITGFAHYSVVDGEVVSSKHDIAELREGCPPDVVPDEHIRGIAEAVGKVKAATPLIEIEARQVRSLSSISYNSLLGDDFSRSVHDEAEITALRGNTSIVNEIGLFVLFRVSGSSCCSCSCSCWGSSSCSSSAVG